MLAKPPGAVLVTPSRTRAVEQRPAHELLAPIERDAPRVEDGGEEIE